jgi:hypothetical protein
MGSEVVAVASTLVASMVFMASVATGSPSAALVAATSTVTAFMGFTATVITTSVTATSVTATTGTDTTRITTIAAAGGSTPGMAGGTSTFATAGTIAGIDAQMEKTRLTAGFFARDPFRDQRHSRTSTKRPAMAAAAAFEPARPDNLPQ